VVLFQEVDIHTFVGSFVLVLVAPLTAIAGGLILSGSPKSNPVPMVTNLGLEEIS